MVAIGEPARIIYTNYRGETAERTITPKRVWYGISDWHPEPQWFLTAFDHDKNADRDFALRDFGSAGLRPGLEAASRWHEAEAERKPTVTVKSRRLGAQIATHEASAAALANYEARMPSALEPDWVHIAKMAGQFGIRYQTNHAFVDFLKAIRALSSPDHADADTLETYNARQIEWSKNTFGPALRTKGIIDHINKELEEIEAEPHDLSEWIDVVILAMDGFWRHGGSVNDLMPRLLAKQQKNMARAWPDWRTMSEGQAIEHDRSNDLDHVSGDSGEVNP